MGWRFQNKFNLGSMVFSASKRSKKSAHTVVFYSTLHSETDHKTHLDYSSQ